MCAVWKYLCDIVGFLSIGIPSIKRENGVEYLVKTLSSLIEHSSDRDRAETILVVFLADLDQQYREAALSEITSKYMSYIDMGFIHIVQVSDC